MSKSTLPRLKALRDEMGKAGITAFIIPGTDPHQSEYYASHWAARTWISGFDGSAGTAVVTTNQAGLWTDSRYFLQAAQQLEDSGFELFKEGLPDTPTIEQWLLTTLPQGATIAIDGTLFGGIESRCDETKLREPRLPIRIRFHSVRLHLGKTPIDPQKRSLYSR